ncbi:hypothetical protein [Mesorhizobium sp. Z1-4]|uniref:hypothetical protein n=1 Tax=Mesorhizobium sp. Z1-4 TaxID=2448478 RepID=UPI000FDB3D94|nr:hypothetical protein [Mesorhizobium sp. Z1-4]
MSDVDKLRRLANLVQELIEKADEKVGPSPYSHGGNKAESWSDWHNRRSTEYAAIGKRLEEQEGARIARTVHFVRVQMGGFKASSTSSLHGALTNWIAGAQRRIAEAAASA